jgi:hypothetical protein
VDNYKHPPSLRKKNIRAAWILAAFALLMFITSIPFWEGILQAIGNQAG